MTNKLSNDFVHYQEDFDYCKKIIKHHSKSFYAAFSQLPEQKAMSVYAIYAFCRRADDIIDVEKKPEKLEVMRDQLDEFQKGKCPEEPMWRALAVVFDHYPLDIKFFYDMLEGQRRDAHFEQPQTQKELEEYSYYVAGSVGLMLLPILSANWQSIIEEAKDLGRAMQITNILRDIGEDLNEGRIYLPKELMDQYGVTEKAIRTHHMSQAFIDLWEFEAHRAEESYKKGLEMIAEIDEECRIPLLTAIYLYREILSVIREGNYDVFGKRHVVNKTRKLLLFKAANHDSKRIALQKR